MIRVPTTDVAVLVVVLALCSLAVAPAAAAAPTDSSTGTTLGDTLDGSLDSSDDSTDDSTDDSSDDSTDDSDSGTNDSAEDSSNDGEDGSEMSSDSSDDSTDDSDDSTDDSSDDGWTTDSNESHASGNDSMSNDSLSDGNLTDGNLTEVLANATDENFSETFEAPSENGTSIIAGLYEPVGETTLDTTTADDVTATVDASADELSATGLLLLDASDPFSSDEPSSTEPNDESTPVEDVHAPGAPVEPGDADAAPPNDAGAGASPSPSTGFAFGLGVFAVGTAARPDPNLPSTLAGLGTTLAAGLAPIAGRSGVFERLVRMLAPLRYSRYDDSDPLAHEARAEVYEVVDDAPGAYLSEVAERADLPLSTARHHIRVLEREEVVSGAKVRGKRRFYPAYTDGIELAAALNDDATAAVIDAVARFGSASVSDIATELGRDPSTVSHHLKRLAEDDIVVRERDGRAVMNKLSAEARTALDPGRDSTAEEPAEALASD